MSGGWCWRLAAGGLRAAWCWAPAGGHWRHASAACGPDPRGGQDHERQLLDNMALGARIRKLLVDSVAVRGLLAAAAEGVPQARQFEGIE